jgi:hypothetical protein
MGSADKLAVTHSFAPVSALPFLSGCLHLLQVGRFNPTATCCGQKVTTILLVCSVRHECGHKMFRCVQRTVCKDYCMVVIDMQEQDGVTISLVSW